jgi:two-component system sensor histidine kinase YesM
MKHTNTLQRQLFSRYASIICILLFIFFTLLCIVYIFNEQNRILDSLETISSSVSNNLAQEADQLSTASLNAIYSKQLKESLDRIDPQKPDWNSISTISSIIGAIIGPNSTVAQINVYSPKNYIVGWGTYSIHHPVQVDEEPWFANTVKLHGSKYISRPSLNSEFIKISSYMKDHWFISMYRQYFDAAYKPQGFVESSQDCKVFFSYIDDLLARYPDIDICVMNKDGENIYPYKTQLPVSSYFQNVLDRPSGSGPHIVKGENGQSLFLADSYTEYTGWYVVVTQKTSYLLRQIYPFLLLFILSLLVSLGVLLGLCYKTSKKLLYPLNSLKNQLENLSLEKVLDSDDSLLIDQDLSTTDELDALIRIYNGMYLSLKSSSVSVLNAKAEETKAKLFATQSMLKPHFLYNSLTNIEIMAENGMTDDIRRYCNNLSHYIRYISSDSLENVDIAKEIEYSICYLDCMKARYGSKLIYTISVPPEAEKTVIPKLTLQPLIENSLKYAFHNSPPWIIDISCEVKGAFCFLSVSDNGVGFTEESMKKLQEELHQIKKTKDLYSLKIGGLGLKSVYLRLLFMYGEAAEILPTGCQNAGARIVIKIPFRPAFVEEKHI